MKHGVGGALCESSLIPFLVLRRSLADARCMLECRAVTLSVYGERKTWNLEILEMFCVNFAPGKIPSGGRQGARAPENV